MSDPVTDHWQWVKCVNADADGKDVSGNVHFPCKDCEWQAKPAP